MNSVKQEFLKKWIWGLRKYSSQKKNMSLMERKKAIKLSADLAMASTRNKTTRWSRALIANASSREHVSGSGQRVRKRLTNHHSHSVRIRSCRTSLLRRNRGKDRVVASFIAKRLVQKRTKRLKSLLPGGEFMDGDSLVEETLDYIESLRAQVEVMRCLVTASELMILNPS